jgi:ribosome maturation factor RimP
MNIETQVSTIEKMIAGLLKDQPQYFLVEIKIKPTNNVKVFLDGDQGITIEKCISINRPLYKLIEEAKLFPNDDFSLEVSSPGLDEPLKLFRQYVKNVGRPVEVLLKDGQKVEGKLVEVNESSMVVEETKGKNQPGWSKAPKPAGDGNQGGKKKELLLHNFSFDQIKSTKLQIVF